MEAISLAQGYEKFNNSYFLTIFQTNAFYVSSVLILLTG